MIIDCDDCAARGPGCGDCVVSVLLGGPPEEHLDETERWAVHNLAAAGLLPPLRMVSVQDTVSTQREIAITPRRRSAG